MEGMTVGGHSPLRHATCDRGRTLPMNSLRFRSVIEINDINPYVLITAKRAAQIQKDWRKPLPVRVQLNGTPDTPWRTNLMPIGDGSFYLYLHGDMRKASGTKVGDIVTIEAEFDGEYRSGPTHSIPQWFNDALNRNSSAKQAWDVLIPSRQKEILRYFSRLKSPEAKARNAQQAIRVLSGCKERFMARSWNE
jgi:Domain of unknown function (DUF1905)/Bacteriocin-protection, YdeI or OmpD-Associated